MVLKCLFDRFATSYTMLFAVIPMGGQMRQQLGSMLAGPSIVPEAEMLGAGPEMYNCMGCTCPVGSVP